MTARALASLSGFHKARRFAVPRAMIASASERRLAGDFLGALRVARISPSFELRAIEKSFGRELRDALELALLNLAPDLLRWHLPRVGDAIWPERKLTLSEWTLDHKRLALWLETPRADKSVQDVVLRAGACDDANGVMLACQWDVRRAHELLFFSGGHERLPFFTRDGRARQPPFGTPSNPAPDQSREPELHFEAVTRLQDSPDRLAQAAALCGIELVSARGYYSNEWTVSRLALPRLLDVVRWVRGARVDRDAYVRVSRTPALGVWIRGIDAETPRLTSEAMPGLGATVVDAFEVPRELCLRSPDLDLLRTGAMAPQQLHPLVASALFPDWQPGPEPLGPRDAAPVERLRARCGSEWHWLAFEAGRLTATQHSPEQAEREAVLGALGGKVPGCFRAVQAWSSHGKSGKEAKVLRLQRGEFRARVFHGDVDGVLRMLDVDRSLAAHGTGRSLLHELPWLGAAALPRILALGLDLEQLDSLGRTPFQVALEEGDEDSQKALLAAGAKRLKARKK